MRLRYNSRAPVAQLDRASGFEPAGRRFKSCRAHHLLLRAIPDIATTSYGTAAPKSKIGRCTELDRAPLQIPMARYLGMPAQNLRGAAFSDRPVSNTSIVQ